MNKNKPTIFALIMVCLASTLVIQLNTLPFFTPRKKEPVPSNETVQIQSMRIIQVQIPSNETVQIQPTSRIQVQALTPKKIKTDVVILSPSVVAWEERRQAQHRQFQRENWKPEQAVLIFILGNRAGQGLSEEVDTSSVRDYSHAMYLRTECRDFGDEPNNPDNTASTACKVYEAYKHIVKTYEAKYVWRICSDSYLNMRYFYNTVMHTLPATRLFYGRLRRSTAYQADLQLSAQPKLMEVFGMIQFGQYMSGAGWLVSYDVAELIASFKIPPHITWFDDVMMGMWLRPFQVQFMDVGSLFLDLADASIQNNVDYLVVHRVFGEKWDNIDDSGRFGHKSSTDQRYEKHLMQVMDGCGEICDTNIRGLPSLFFDHIKKKLDCIAIGTNAAIDAAGFEDPPPKTIPENMMDAFTFSGRIGINLAYDNSKYLGTTAMEPLWSREMIDDMVNKAKRKELDGNYGRDETNWVIEGLSWMDVQDSEALVIGSENPWVEACVLQAGARHVTTLEYGNINSTHPQVSTMTPEAMRERFGELMNHFDIVVSFSSLEHSGLGRYGDALNPWGDKQAVARAWCLTKPGGRLLIAVMPGGDGLTFNLHRTYGPLQLSHLLANWEQVWRAPGGLQVVHVLRKPLE